MTQLTRRQFARQFAHLCAAFAATALVPLGGEAAATKRYRLRPRPALVPLLGPATRVDLILDVAGTPGQVSPGARVRADRLGTGATLEGPVPCCFHRCCDERCARSEAGANG